MNLVKTATTIDLIPSDNIIYIESYQNYSKVFLASGKWILSTDSLVKHEKNLDRNFFRIHNSFIVNLTKLVRYFRKGEVEIFGGIIAPVARRRRSKFLSEMERVNRMEFEAV